MYRSQILKWVIEYSQCKSQAMIIEIDLWIYNDIKHEMITIKMNNQSWLM